ncbi:MAG: hypothetical protein SAK29_18325 [Scytonema sp. PMC 1069.18]|nr:hypothetical protein [Scytonema sp. PMC 1069.18]MEC4880432.1 hypothetical protein [Scytonema sp. PMC 1070.18]
MGISNTFAQKEIKVDLDAEEKGENPEYIKLLEELIEQSTKQQFNIQNNHYYFTDTSDRYQLEGYYYPIRLYDTYGLIFDCSIDDKTNPQPIDVFKNLQQQAATKSGSIGKTWMVSGSLVPGIKRDRSLERTFQVLGTAFGGGAIVSGVVTQHIDKPFVPIN